MAAVPTSATCNDLNEGEINASPEMAKPCSIEILQASRLETPLDIFELESQIEPVYGLCHMRSPFEVPRVTLPGHIACVIGIYCMKPEVKERYVSYDITKSKRCQTIQYVHERTTAAMGREASANAKQQAMRKKQACCCVN